MSTGGGEGRTTTSTTGSCGCPLHNVTVIVPYSDFWQAKSSTFTFYTHIYPTSWPAKASFQWLMEEHGDIKCFWRSGWFIVMGRSGMINLLINFRQHLMTCLTLIQLCGSELMQNIWQEDWKMVLVCSELHYFNLYCCFYWKLLNYLVRWRTDYYMSYAAKARRKLSL